MSRGSSRRLEEKQWGHDEWGRDEWRHDESRLYGVVSPFTVDLSEDLSGKSANQFFKDSGHFFLGTGSYFLYFFVGDFDNFTGHTQIGDD